jgi:hypothetical protein
MKSRTAFTRKDVVITLGCVIVLLATVGAIGHSGRNRAKQMVCLSNLRQWGSAFMMFAADNDGFFMRGWTNRWPEGPVHQRYWMEALRPYYANHGDLRLCPAAANIGSETGAGQFNENGDAHSAWGRFSGNCGEPSTAWPWVVGCDYGSYGINAWVHNIEKGADPYGGPDVYWRTPNVTRADKVPLFGDHQFLDCWPKHQNAPPQFDNQPWSQSQMTRICISRHGPYVNWAFLDFSARKVGLKELWTLKWHREYDTCGPWTRCGGIQPSDWPDWMRDFQDY